MRKAHDEFELLCETCGYSVQSLPRDGACPECGRSIASSLPGARPGSSWQQRPVWRSLVDTNLESLRDPRRTMSRIRFERPRLDSLLSTNIAAAALLMTIPIALLVVVTVQATNSAAPNSGGRWAMLVLAGLGVSIGASAIATVGLFVLTSIEQLGVRLIGRFHGWRITPTVAAAVCRHASIGWLIGGFLWAIGVVGVGIVSAAWGIDRNTWAFVLPPLGFLGGLLTFETIVYLGIRQCRFANRSPPNSPDADDRPPTP